MRQSYSRQAVLVVGVLVLTFGAWANAQEEEPTPTPPPPAEEVTCTECETLLIGEVAFLRRTVALAVGMWLSFATLSIVMKHV
jgi:hypothetical protein